MTKINCDVTNCSYNCSGNCFSNRIDIGGMASCSENDTCCGSFLDKKHYSDLTNCAENCTPCDCLVWCETLVRNRISEGLTALQLSCNDN